MDLYKHNKEAYDKVMASFDTKNKAAVVHATGTGKSYIIAAVAENFAKVLIVAPNNFVLNETRNVCHKGCEFRTYASVMYNEGEANKYDLIVLDEFHRGGAEKWGIGVQKLIEANPNAKLLGTSATNIRYLDGQRNMADELFDGNVVSYLPLKEAIDRKILPSPTYVSSLFTTEDTIKAFKSKAERSLQKGINHEGICRKMEGIARNWENANGVPVIIRKYITKDMQRIIVFCSKVKRSAEARGLLSKWFGLAGFKRVRYYNIDYQEKRLESEMADFQSPLGDYDMKVAISVNMLNEGVHIPHVDGVIMLRSTISRIILEQQIGRCLTSNNVSAKPVVLDLVNNMDSINYNGLFTFESNYCSKSDEEQKENDGFPFKVIDECRDFRIALDNLYKEIAGEYTKEECQTEADKCKSRNDFSVKAPSYYNCALRHGWLDEIKPSDSKFKNRFYLQEVLDKAKTYSSRKEFRKKDGRSYSFLVNNGHLHLLDEILPKEVTNWTDEMLIEEAKKYDKRTDFFKGSHSAYCCASKRGVLDMICEHMGEYSNSHKWTEEELLSFAKQCKTKKEWRERFKTSYAIASQMGVLNDICNKAGLDYFVPESDESIIEKSRIYGSSGILYKENKKLYDVLVGRGLLRVAFPNARKLPTYKTDEELLEEASQFKTKTDLTNHSVSLYSILRKRGLLNRYYTMIGETRLTGKAVRWSKQECIEAAKRCDCISHFKRDYKGAYGAAKRNGWLDECRAVLNNK
ncbi:MAG: DEAD/DEAH box helicase family protein [Prevotellaceae bacterium]|nr:DEAD/DEAH box helicase family protein [Candidatus Faecinaster equi]